MRAARKNLIFTVCLGALLALCACTREVTYTEVVQEASNCFNCHSDSWDAATPAIIAAEAQWENSKHGQGEAVFEGERSSCAKCHCHEGFVDKVAGNEVTGYVNPTMIHCFTCHAPHTDGDFGLRTDAAVTFANDVVGDINSGNLCLNCHQSRRDVREYVADGTEIDEDSHFGPHHGPQGDMLFATGGYEFDGYEYGDMDYHRAVGTNPDGCLGCHYEASEGFTLGGHSFNMEGEIEGEHMLHYDACVDCHEVLEDQEDFDYNDVQTDVAALLAELQGLLYDAGFIVEDDEFPAETVTLSIDEAGALYNYILVKEDRSLGVHNSEYTKDLLESAIAYMESR